MPQNVVQPFPLSFKHDDFHVIAFIEGHPQYEAVGAMISKATAGACSIRAILTRHDQSQIDHINDEEIFGEMRGTSRELCRRSILFERSDLDGGRQHARLAFESHLAEPVVLEFTTLGRASEANGGLTDPGDHSRTESLPIMFRGASTLAGPVVRVTVGGSAYQISNEERPDSGLFHRAFFTEGFLLAAIRAGTQRLQRVESPSKFDAGAEWLFDSDGRKLLYRVLSRDADGSLRIVRGDGREAVRARLCGDALEISEIEARDRSDCFTLAFGDGRFVLSLTGAGDLLKGEFEASASGDRLAVKLRPTEPHWAVARTIKMINTQNGWELETSTTVGE